MRDFSSVCAVFYVTDSDEVYKVIGRARETATPRSRLSSGARESFSHAAELREAIPAVRGLVRRSMSIPVDDSHSHKPSKSHHYCCYCCNYRSDSSIWGILLFS